MLRKAFPYLLLFFALYGGWYYLQQRPRPPLRAQLLPYSATQFDRLTVYDDDQPSFQLSRDEDRWIIEKGNYSIPLPSGRPDSLLNTILRLKSSGLFPDRKPKARLLAHLCLEGDGLSEHIQFYPAPDTMPGALLVRMNLLPDVYVVDSFALLNLPLSFADYRNFQLFRLPADLAIDSLIWETDSLNIPLLALPTDSASLDSLSGAWKQLRLQKIAREFDEIGYADRKIGSYVMYTQRPDAATHHINVFFDSLWQHPFVVQSSQFPLDFFSLDSLLFPTDSIGGLID